MRLTPEALHHLDAPFIKLGIMDTDGVLRTKYLSRDKLQSALASGSSLCNVTFAWDIQDTVYADQPLPDPGFADARLTIDAGSGRTLPWEADTPLLLGDFSNDAGPAGTACPRSLLRRTVARAAKLGLRAEFGPEYEWFAYRETPASLTRKHYRHLTPLSPGMFGYSSLRTGQHAGFWQALAEQLNQVGVPLEGFHTETGPGALEAALVHQSPLEAADRATVFKETVKQVSYRHGLLASFMAKPSAELPGCGGHLHQSVWGDDNVNLFHEPAGRYGMSVQGEQYLAGQLQLLPALMPLFAPFVNSYKRYVPGSWAAVRANWGIDNRTVALRYVSGTPSAARLELRVPGADANPYLVMAAALTAGLYGIEQELTLDLAPLQGSAYEQHIGAPLAKDLGAAAGAMEAEPLVRNLLGEEFTDQFLRSRRWEWQRYQRAVTDWERERYFELA
ncbi:Glutamate--isopropylamine ligase [Neolewinella maritima]|uniref:Glutamate--isopropylamine ligase n=1 Tax=Neolewinella maritima TaxID=1383882 RepID=A0ABM9AWT0_9BACT|nr:glutamine synthetase [Neolewinella maritima]CAH0999194.1 Glutamate--isopropylamine ligase [Neolewinella maritima]